LTTTVHVSALDESTNLDQSGSHAAQDSAWTVNNALDKHFLGVWDIEKTWRLPSIYFVVLSLLYGDQYDLAEQNLADYCLDLQGRLDGQHRVNGDSVLLGSDVRTARHNYDAFSASHTQALRPTKIKHVPAMHSLPITITGLTVGQSSLLKPTSCLSPLLAHYAHGMHCWPLSSSGILETPWSNWPRWLRGQHLPTLLLPNLANHH